MKLLVYPLLVLACLTGFPAQAGPGDILQPREVQWAYRPNGEDFEAVFPRKAMSERRGGWAVVVCAARVDGTLTDCRVGAESPEGDGFGAAVLKTISRFRLKPKLLTGETVGGGIIQIPMVFTHDEGSPPRTFQPGSPAMLVEVLPQDARDTALQFSCPSKADPARKCQAHPFDWERSPMAIEISELAARAVTGTSLVECAVSEAMTLEGCKVGGDAPPELDAELLKLTDAFLAPSKTTDGRTSPAAGSSLTSTGKCSHRSPPLTPR